MRNRIVKKLDEISRSEDVHILYACESGSRAWGFSSRDSDFDVRFVYLRKKECYLSIDLDQKPDVIELPIVDDLDINGWDLRKALRLFHKSNPLLLKSINHLLTRKMTGDELDMGLRDPVFSAFLENQLERMADQGFERRIQRCPVGMLNGLFLEALIGKSRKWNFHEK